MERSQPSRSRRRQRSEERRVDVATSQKFADRQEIGPPNQNANSIFLRAGKLQRCIDATLGMTVDAEARHWIATCVQRQSRSREIDLLSDISVRFSHDNDG